MGKIAIIGDGGWGTALAIELLKKGNSVFLWGAFKSYIEKIAKSRENVKFLKGIRIPDGIKITPLLNDAVRGANIVILAVPSKYLRNILERLKQIEDENPIYVSVAKGIESTTLMRMSEVIRDVLGMHKRVVAVSGPSIAIEVAKGLPTTIVAASADTILAKNIQNTLISKRLRIYTSDDLIGVELGGSLKNIIAIAAGISDSLGFGANTKAAILTRGLAEISRLGVAMGGRRETFSGLSGIGDLITTCISPYSRNRWFGEMLGMGKKTEEILKGTEMIVEGITTAKSAYELSRKYKISMPITLEIYNLIYKNKSPKDVVSDLMLRSPKQEHY